MLRLSSPSSQQVVHRVISDATPQAEMSDDALLRALCGGAESAVEVLYLRHRTSAMALARASGCTGVHAEDVTSEAFTRILHALRHGSGPSDNFCGYLATVVRRLSRTHLQRCRREVLVDDWSPLDHGHTDGVTEHLADSEVFVALMTLPPPWREVLWKIEVLGEPLALLARDQGRTPNAMAALAYRARRGLRAVMTEPAA